MLKTEVKKLLETALEERQDLFLIEFTVSGENHISVILDGDNGVLVEDCMFISRAIEHNLDREEVDFSLEVASAGATMPLTHNRQYVKNIGRTLEVKTTTNTVEGTLTDADKEGVTLKWKTREPKPIGKGKVTVQKEEKIDYSNIVEAKVLIKF